MQTLEGVRLWTAEDLEQAVAIYAAEMCSSNQFARAAEAAELWIADNIPGHPQRAET
jgi:hypothetical protein